MNKPRKKLSTIGDELSNTLPSVLERDPVALASLLPYLQHLAELDELPGAMRTLARRLVGVVGQILEEQVDSAVETPKLGQGIAKLVGALADVAARTESALEIETVATPVPMRAPPVPEIAPKPTESFDKADVIEELDLLRKFVSQQRSGLEEFEVAILEREKGSSAGEQHVVRYLHTLKGEFGVLDLSEWAGLVHDIESALEERRLGTEGLLKFKDIFYERLEILHLPEGRSVSPEYRSLVLGALVSAVPSAESQFATAPVSSFLEDASFLVDFIAEGGDHIHNIEKSLLKLEVSPSDDESIHLVFRSCHTLKGLAGFLELGDIQRLAHAAETLMDRARNHLITLGPQHVDVLLETTDAFRHLVDGLENLVGGNAYVPPANLEILIERLRDADYLPPLPPMPKESVGKKMGALLVEKGVSSDLVETALQTQKDGDTRPLGEILVESGEVDARMVGQILGQQVQAKRNPQQSGIAVEETIRVPVARLDLLIDAIGEAVIAQSMVWADPRIQASSDLAMEKKVAQASLMLRQIQELSMSLRMVSIRSTFQKMSRLVRDLARKLDKQIDLVMDGEDTELDKTVVENIGDPLIHMVRNSVDHGVETPTERLAAGKPEKGTIHLRAFHKAGSVYIEIEDDGKGLDRDAILRKAVAAGKARADQVYSDADVYQMVFLPGLSTAKTVTDVSGRGVGMDVVKKNIESLRGMVEIRSERGKGTCFTIRLPLTLAIIQGMVVRSRDERYIVPTLSILTTLLLDSVKVQTVVDRGEFFELRGELIRIVRLDEVFGARRSERSPGSVVLVVEDVVGRKVGIQVDQILEQQQVVIKNIGGGMAQVPGVSGGAIMSDGSVSLILDVGGVVKIASE